MIVVKKDPDLKYNLEDMNRYTARNFEMKDFLAKNYPKIHYDHWRYVRIIDNVLYN